MTFRLTYLILVIYLLILWVFLNIWGIDAINGVIDFEFYADSETYMEYAKDGITFFEMILFNPNLIGPVYLARFLGNNYNLIFFLNAFILFYSYKLVTTNFKVNRYLLLFLWILSPMMISSVLSINKEIVAVLSSIMVLVYIKNGKYLYLAGAICLGLFVRWQQVLFVLLLASLFSNLNPLRNKMFLSFILLLLGISILYPLATIGTVQEMIVASEDVNNADGGSGIYFLLNELQSKPFMYTILFIPKLIFLLFSTLTRVGTFGKLDSFYNDTIVFAQCVCYLFISILLVIKKKISFKNLFFFSALIYCLLFTLSPIFAPRYLFIFYILSAVAVSEEIDNPEDKLT